MADNSLSPHGGALVERVMAPEAVDGAALSKLPRLAARDQIARECVNLAYGFFSPLEGFMGRADLDCVAREMRLANGYVWSIPIVLDLSAAEVAHWELGPGKRALLTYQGQPLATLEVEEVYSYDKEALARQVYGTADLAHPGVQRTWAYQERFVAGAVTLVSRPLVSAPFAEFWQTPGELRRSLAERGWQRVVAHQTRNVPHAGHEWLMKGAFLAAEADGVLVSAVIGEKKAGDYIDEAIALTHNRLRTAGFFREDKHLTTTLLWDMRYAGPREAVFHALVRKNLGCTHHMFGRDHAGVGSYYDTYAAHRIFEELPDLGIKSVLTLEWWHCPACGGTAYEGLCGHRERKEDLAGTLIRSIIQGGAEPAATTLRAEVLEVVRECAERYGFGSPFVGEEYLAQRTPVLTLPAVAGFCSGEEG